MGKVNQIIVTINASAMPKENDETFLNMGGIL